MQKKLFNIKELSEVVGLSERKIPDFLKRRVISAIKISCRCIRCNPEKVLSELETHYGQDAISARPGKGHHE